MKKTVSILIASMAFAASSVAIAGTSEVEWTNPDKYTDVRAANETKKSFQKRTFKNLDKHIEKRAEELPEGYKIKLEFTDVNLAGEVKLRSSQLIRVIDRVFIPSFEFNYQLIDANGTVVKEATEVKIKDMGFMDSSSHNRYRSQSLSYEKIMLDEWFEETFADIK